MARRAVALPLVTRDLGAAVRVPVRGCCLPFAGKGVSLLVLG